MVIKMECQSCRKEELKDFLRFLVDNKLIFEGINPDRLIEGYLKDKELPVSHPVNGNTTHEVAEEIFSNGIQQKTEKTIK